MSIVPHGKIAVLRQQNIQLQGEVHSKRARALKEIPEVDVRL